MVIKTLKTCILATTMVLFAGSSALTAPYMDEKPYVQPVAVQNILPEPTIKLATPSFENSKANFTTHEELLTYIKKLEKSSEHMQVSIIGYSQEGRSIPMLTFKKGNTSKKPTVWLQAQVHGNEPAAGESVLAVASELANGQLGKDVLDKINVIIVPRMNPDGSYYFERRTADKLTDINRDNVKFELPETILLHQAYNKVKAEVVLDAHEYSVASNYKDLGSKGHLAYYDVLLLSSTNPNVPTNITQLADNILIADAGKAIEQAGHSWHWYYVVESSKTHPKKFAMADGVPIIGRNAYGLQPAISILIETRGIGIGKQDFKRRVASQYTTYTTMLRSVADNAAQIKSEVSKARQELIAKGENTNDAATDKIVILSNPRPIKDFDIKLINLESNLVENIRVEGATHKEFDVKLERVRPYAYILPAAYKKLAEKLSYSGLDVRKTVAPMTVEVESYKVVDNKVNTKYFEGHFRNTVTTEVTNKKVWLPAASYVIYMAQPNGNLAALCLEPESQASFVTFNLIPVEKNDTVPVYRLMHNEKIDTVQAFGK